ncbi:FAD/NAD(P)-binding protein [Actinokineospora cianjurensis]|uniref:Putative NAD(P)/FAD-binding protein YdhS n=1 Tax=Actinokineospora cianjurensis TaxID=585224 RepID=A0A421BBR9_9PSEU|nr:FAD/NAD(P)-binding protein [Actinokineospora cianjurensis]RLK61815.1 putative NAD(P)/FAD-binding protein YdhS [Actinokineospora cianjurensis]
MSSLSRIGVVGGGASAVCLLDALAARTDLAPGAITVFEPSKHLWRGRPYQPDLDVVRVNATPQDMSVRAGDDHHMADWLAGRNLFEGSRSAYSDPLSGAQFVPRAVYGDYLEQSARAALLALVRRGWRVELVRNRVERAQSTPDGLSMWTDKGVRHDVDYAVFSVGAGRPADLYALSGHPGFIGEPYPVRDSLSGIAPDADIALIGAGLTAVDVVLALAARGHQGRIRLFSRRNVLPGVRQRPVHHVLRHFTPARFRALAAQGERLTLTDLVAVMAAELAEAGEDIATVRREIDAVRSEDAVDRLRRQLAEVDSPSIAMRIVQQAVPEAGPDIWPLLTEQDKNLVLAENDRALMSLCCPMPPGNAAVLLRLIDAGQVELVSGLVGIEPTGHGFRLATARGEHTTEHRADVVVNAVNARLRKLSEKATPLFSSLVAGGAAEPHPRGGLHVERATSRLTVDGVPNPRLYGLGDPTLGSLFFTFGVQSLVDRAVDIAAAISEHSSATAVRADELLPA